MELVSYQEYLAYAETVNYIFLFIGIIGFFFYKNNYAMTPITKTKTLFLFLLMVAILGAWPLLGNGEDRSVYYAEAYYIANTGITLRLSDPGYFLINLLLTLFPLDWYFYLHSILYVGGIYIFCKSTLPKQYGALFLAMIMYFQFVPYGVNTMRSGLAGSFMLIALSFRDRKIYQWLFLLFASMIHKSFALPALCYLISNKYNHTSVYFKLWLLSIPISAVAGSSLQNYFSTLLGDDYRASYLTTSAEETHYSVGFRIDFILFSCAPILMGYYMIYKRKFLDPFYNKLFNTYLLANTFWILVIRASFSDRIAYLSWFIFSPVLFYPLLKDPKIVPRSHIWVALSILALTLFRTYV